MCSKSRHNMLREHKYQSTDITTYNKDVSDPRKKLVQCECGRRYIYWNQYQHVKTLFHRKYESRRDGVPPPERVRTHFCQVKSEGRPHGKWSEQLSESCPKCECLEQVLV